MTAKTLYEKIWNNHVVYEEPGKPSLLYIDRHLLHEGSTPAFGRLAKRGRRLRRPDLSFATADHYVLTSPGAFATDPEIIGMIESLARYTGEQQIPYFGVGEDRRGIVHIVGPEQGLTLPGLTLVCGDSHTATHGAFGALAFGIGTSEVEMVLATQCLLQRRPQTCEVRVDGRLAPGVSAKDVILALLSRIGIAGGTGHVFEYRGEAIEALSMEQRMTICNMSIEGGARAGLIAPDDTTFEYLAGRPHAPQGAAWDDAVARWRALPSDPEAAFDRSVTIDAASLEPMVTYGTNPGMGLPISARVPDPAAAGDDARRRGLEQALAYMDLQPGQALLGQKVDVVFIGSCTNGWISDLRLAAAALKGRHVADGVRMMVVPGSDEVKREAEREGLHEIFRAAGADWREAGCSMCIAMNGDQLSPGQYSVSTSNRNFEGRQGKGGRTFLASPLTAAASALTGVVTDVRTLL